MSAGLYFAYLWPAVEPLDEGEVAAGDVAAATEKDDDETADPPADGEDEPASVAT